MMWEGRGVPSVNQGPVEALFETESNYVEDSEDVSSVGGKVFSQGFGVLPSSTYTEERETEGDRLTD